MSRRKRYWVQAKGAMFLAGPFYTLEKAKTALQQWSAVAWRVAIQSNLSPHETKTRVAITKMEGD